MKHLLACASLLLTSVLHAAESHYVFMAEGMNADHIRQAVQKHLPTTPDAPPCELISLPAECKTAEQARTQARAMECGITALPALVLADEQGPFASIPLRKLTPETLQEARANKDAAGRREEAQKHRFEAHLFLLCALATIEFQDDSALASRIAESRSLMEQAQATLAHRQLIGLRILYPLLMEQYKRAYRQGVAHNPASEAKLLEAIAALEAARDLDPATALGRQAFDERERLRAARRKSRQYE